MHTHLATYAKHRAHATLQNIVWSTNPDPNDSSQHPLLIAQRTTVPIPIHTLLDLSIVYAHLYPSQLQNLFRAQYDLSHLSDSLIADDVLPTFTVLLSSDAHQALASKRKISESIFSFLFACSPIPSLVRPFAHSKDFILALASLYDAGLTRAAKPHGGSRALLAAIIDDADDWPRIWIQTKIALIDPFHIVLSALLDDLSSSQQSHTEKDRVFDTLFALLDLEGARPNDPPTPFLDLSLIADYQHAYNLSDKLSSILNSSPNSHTEQDPRLDLLETTLVTLLSGVQKKNPGMLKVVLRSKTRTRSANVTVKSESTPPPIPSSSQTDTTQETASMQSKIDQILAILPHLSQSYIARLLKDDRFGGNVERVLEGLLDGSLGSEDVEEEEREEVFGKGKQRENPQYEEKGDSYDITQRRNIFDEEEIDVTRMRFGKQDVGSDLFQDRTAVERMKHDILRRVKDMDEAEAELFEEEEDNKRWKAKAQVRSDDVYDEDEIGIGRVHPLRDGESDSDASESHESGPEPFDPETIIEQAYLRDPSVFNRNANTRRGKSRIELRSLTGWADEQIEGWKVMLERTPGKKARLEEKHGFGGNVKGMEVPIPGPSGGGGRGRKGMRGGTGTGNNNGGGESMRGSKRGGGGRGRGGRGGGVNRKRGHDKKIARAGGMA